MNDRNETWDLRGKTVMITGANSGIGWTTALGIARRGATLVMVCRDEARGRAARDELVAETGNEAVELMVADLGEPESLVALAADFQERHDALHVLINNAGSVFNPRQETAAGLEKTFAVNHLGPFLLTNLLLDTLKKSAPARIINLSSGLHPRGRIDFDDLMMKGRYNSLQAYNNSKLATVLFTYELARRLEGTDVTVNAVHPGIVKTNLGRNDSSFPWYAAIFMLIWVPFMVDANKGAETSLHVAAAPELSSVTGKYFAKSKPVKSARHSYDEDLARRLWTASEDLVARWLQPASSGRDFTHRRSTPPSA